MQNQDFPGHISVFDNNFQAKKNRTVYLQGTEPFYQHKSQNPITKVAPATTPDLYSSEKNELFEAYHDDKELNSVIYDQLKPMILCLRILGIFPITNSGQIFSVTTPWLIYSGVVLAVILGYTGYIKWDNVSIIKSAEGRFEEAVIDYLFTVYLVPIVINPIAIYEAHKQARVLTNMIAFEKIYNRTSKKTLVLHSKNKSLMLCITVLVLGCTAMIVTHITMVDFKFIQIIPYCYINTVTYMLGAAWFAYCDLIGKSATVLAEDFQEALKNIGPSFRIAEYRSLWMMLSKIIRDTGNSFGYALTFLCLYLFLIITLTIYGMLSQLQEGFGTKDIGLILTAGLAIALLYFVCDEAHYASTCVRVRFQKKILLIELSWMNDDAQQEITMFLKATEMNNTDMCLCGFFEVNRNLFKSLLATMVTYLVVLLQFQISIPDGAVEETNSTIALTFTTKAP